MTSLMSFNGLTQTINNRNRLIAWVQTHRPRYTVLCDDDGSIANQIRGYTTIIRRAVTANDDEDYIHQTEQGWLDAHAALAAGGDFLYALNEPAGYGDLSGMLQWLTALMKLAKVRGIHLVVGNWGVGSPDEKQIEAGVFDEFVQTLIDCECVLGLHEYFYEDPVAEAPWLCGRCEFWLDRYPNLPIVLTEHGRDKGGGISDGWQAAGWGESGYETRLAAAAPVCHHLPRCIFCAGSGGGRWITFDIQACSDAFFNFIASDQESSVINPVLPPTLMPTPVTVVSVYNQSVNLRVQPNTLQAPIGSLVKGDQLQVRLQKITGAAYPKGTQTFNTWYYADTPKGWFASELLTLQTGTTVPVEPWIINLSVPYVSQIDVLSALSNNDCGIASWLMLERFWMLMNTQLVPSLPTVDILEPYTPLAIPPPNTPKGLSFADVQALAKKLGFYTTVLSGLTTALISQYLAASRPVFALVDYSRYNPLAGVEFAHFCVIVGESASDYNTHDPYKAGANYRVSKTQMLASMQNVIGNSVDFQGLVLGL